MGVQSWTGTSEDRTFNPSHTAAMLSETAVAGSIRGAGFTERLQQSVVAYNEATRSLSAINEMYNSNMYINESLSSQQRQLRELQDKARNHVMRARQRQMLAQYDVQRTRFRNRVILGAIVVTCVCTIIIMLASKHQPPVIPPWLAGSSVALIIVTYVLVVFLYMSQNALRRRTDWNKFYFGSYSKGNGGSDACPAS